MNLNRGQTNCGNGVPQGDTVVRESTGIEDNARRRVCRFVKRVDENTFVIRLVPLNGHAKICGYCSYAILDLVQGCGTVNVRLASPQPVQIWATQDQDFFCHSSRLLIHDSDRALSV
jgi:hypothetical protein